MDKQQQVDLERRLENWGAWSRSGSGISGACGSAERRYVAPRDDDQTRAERINRTPIDVGDAELLEQAVAKLRAPRMRKLIVMRYSEQADKVRLAKMLDCSPILVEPARITALGAVQYWLDHAAHRVLFQRSMRKGLQSSTGSNMCQSYPPNDVTAP